MNDGLRVGASMSCHRTNQSKFFLESFAVERPIVAKEGVRAILNRLNGKGSGCKRPIYIGKIYLCGGKWALKRPPAGTSLPGLFNAVTSIGEASDFLETW